MKQEGEITEKGLEKQMLLDEKKDTRSGKSFGEIK